MVWVSEGLKRLPLEVAEMDALVFAKKAWNQQPKKSKNNQKEE